MSSGGGLVKIAGIDKERICEFLDIEVDDGAFAEFLSRRNGALLGVDIAGDRNMKQRYVWETGKEFAISDFGGLTLYMAGVFTPKDPTLRSVILVGDLFLEEVDNRRGEGNQVLVKIGHRDDAPRVAKAIDALDFPVKLQTSTQQAALDQAVADLDEMLRYAAHVIAAVAIVIFIGLANATSMAVRERVREVGMLRSLGFSRRKVVSLIAGEAFSLSLAGGLIGCGVAYLMISLVGGRCTPGRTRSRWRCTRGSRSRRPPPPGSSGSPADCPPASARAGSRSWRRCGAWIDERRAAQVLRAKPLAPARAHGAHGARAFAPHGAHRLPRGVRAVFRSRAARAGRPAGADRAFKARADLRVLVDQALGPRPPRELRGGRPRHDAGLRGAVQQGALQLREREACRRRPGFFPARASSTASARSWRRRCSPVSS